LSHFVEDLDIAAKEEGTFENRPRIRSHFAIVCVCTPSCSAISLREIRFVRSIVGLSTKFLLTVECRM